MFFRARGSHWHLLNKCTPFHPKIIVAYALVKFSITVIGWLNRNRRNENIISACCSIQGFLIYEKIIQKPIL